VFCADAVSLAPNIVAIANVAARESEFHLLAENCVIMFLFSFLFQTVQQCA
jgi:hypothetical protein